VNLRFKVSYIGTRYSGFQSQKEKDTVQNQIVSKIKIPLRLKDEDISNLFFTCCGRTDAGVHAFGQVFNIHLTKKCLENFGFCIDIDKKLHSLFYHPTLEQNLDLTKKTYKRDNPKQNRYLKPLTAEVEKECSRLNLLNKKEIKTLTYNANSLLGDDIFLSETSIVPNSFHSRFSCVGRSYKYFILEKPTNDPFWIHRALWVRKSLDWDKIRQSFPYLIGEKDFKSFTKGIYKNERTIRRIDYLETLNSEIFPDIHIIRIKGSGFLHNMIRILVGCFLKIGQGDENPEYVDMLLKAKDRKLGPETSKAHGLYFDRASYNMPDFHVPQY